MYDTVLSLGHLKERIRLYETPRISFDILLTVNLSITLAINQLNAQIVYNKFIICLYMFQALLCSSSGDQIILYSIGYRHTL